MSASFSATGRRKTASARVTLVPGTGQITINKRAFEEYFGTLSMQNKVLHPFQVANVTNQFDAVIAANGGGVTSESLGLSSKATRNFATPFVR